MKHANLILIALIAGGALPSLAHAGSIVDYGFSADASTTLGGQSFSLSGLISAALDGELSAQVQLTGAYQTQSFTTPFSDQINTQPPGVFSAGDLRIGYAP